ncbi:MAG: hypothetical protein RRA94_05365 [Bacteroidota bacterium]|nr:hypothetical protein [Bacteroidota bacterium]
MRRQIIISVFMLAAVLTACGGGESGEELSTVPPPVKLYGVQNAVISYEYSGGASGTKTHTIANYGIYQALLDSMSFSFQGQQRNVYQLDLTSDTVQWSIDLSTMEGVRSSFDTSRIRRLVADFTEEEKQDFQASFILRGGGSKVGTETILDRECDVYELGMGGITVALWNGLTMKMDVVMGGENIIMTAVDLDLDFTPEADMFLPPKEATIKEPEVISSFPEGHPPVNPPQEPLNEMPEGHPPIGN